MERSLGVAVIGAGITGLTVADRLVKAGRDVRIFDKSPANGGRISSRDTCSGDFDHGAPEIQVTNPEFDTFLNGLGAISDGNGSRYGAPRMRALFDPLSDHFNISSEVEVTAIDRENRGWIVRTASGRSFAHYHTVIVTIPAPQAANIIRACQPDLAAELDQVKMQPVWTCLVEFSEKLDLPGKVNGGGTVMRADRMSSKPARDDAREAWVIHMRPDFASDETFADPAVMAPIILDAFGENYGIELPAVEYLNAHRWRYAFAEEPLGVPFAGDPTAGLLIGGDWTLGARAQDGYESGGAMAQAILSREIVNV